MQKWSFTPLQVFGGNRAKRQPFLSKKRVQEEAHLVSFVLFSVFIPSSGPADRFFFTIYRNYDYCTTYPHHSS
jgi:hypothetical protein